MSTFQEASDLVPRVPIKRSDSVGGVSHDDQVLGDVNQVEIHLEIGVLEARFLA